MTAQKKYKTFHPYQDRSGGAPQLVRHMHPLLGVSLVPSLSGTRVSLGFPWLPMSASH
jgi:hypothetical protein